MFRRRKENNNSVKLNITSMMYMFTILMVFLMFSYSVEEVNINLIKGLSLPKSESQKAMKSSLTIQLSRDMLQVDRRAVTRLRKGKFHSSQIKEGYQVRPLYRYLMKHKKRAAKAADDKDKNIVLFMADKRVPFETVDQVLKTAGMAGFPNFRFTVYAK